MRSIQIVLIGVILTTAMVGRGAPTIRRGRNEGTTFIPASNVMGNGSIVGAVSAAAGYSEQETRLDPCVYAGVGISNLLQVSATLVPYGPKGMGPIAGHVQLTYPGNDKLRFFGLAMRGDLYLSTAVDTLSLIADYSKPDYNPYLLPSLIADVDCIARWNRFPLKVYTLLTLADNPQLLHQYRQAAVVLGAEWKLDRHSYYCDAGISLYRERCHRFNRIEDAGYKQYYAWVAPGGRYRLWNTVSLVGSVRFTLFQHLKLVRPLTPDLFGVRAAIEAPIYFRQTDTEAIRSLIFAEQNRGADHRRATGTQTPTRDHFGNMGLGVAILDGESFDYRKEEQLLIREREEIQRKMDEIEALLYEVADEEK